MAQSETQRKGWIVGVDSSRTDMPEPGKSNGTFTLEQLQAAVGGYIEVIQPAPGLAGTEGKVFLVDEEGLLKQLKPNYAGAVTIGRPVFGPLVVIPEETFE
jgi:hypothetical protein